MSRHTCHTRQQSVSVPDSHLSDITGIIQPPPSALTAATAYDPHADAPALDYAPRSSSHQRTLTGNIFDNCQPFLTRAATTIRQHSPTRASLHSPTKSLASFIPSRAAIESGASQPKVRALQNWFNGSSAPVKLGVAQQDGYDSESASGEEYSSEEEEDNDNDDDEDEEGPRGNMMANLFNRGSSLTRGSNETARRPEDTPTPTKAPSQPNAASKFSWLLSTQKNAAVPPPVPSPTYHNPDDELLSINISQALSPHGPADPLNPSSFHDLLTNAEALLSRYQKSYRQMSTALVDARSEQSAQEDELDEAETRVRHLKMQLETMAARATEQDEQMRSLMEDLAFERRARQEEEAARKRSLALIRGPAQCEHNACQDTTPRRRARTSGSELSVDSGFESECETDAASVFSRNCLSPTGTDHSSIHDVEDATPKGKKPQLVQRRSTYDKVREGAVNLEQGSWGCANCEGGAQSAVWGRLAKEREENRTLRMRVETLEEAVEGALNVVDGPWGL